MTWTRTSYRRKNKLAPGRLITSTNDLLEARDSGAWIFFGKRAYHPQWICNMSFQCVCSYIRGKTLRLAIRNDEWPYVFVGKFMESHVPEKSSEWWASCTEIPGVHIMEITKEAVIRECELAAQKHAGQVTVRVQVTFELPERPVDIPIALLPEPTVVSPVPSDPVKPDEDCPF